MNFRKAVARVLRTPTSGLVPVVTILFVGAFRLLIEVSPYRREGQLGERELEGMLAYFVHGIGDGTAFYISTWVCWFAILRLLMGPHPGLPTIVSIGTLFGLTPPIVGYFYPPWADGFYDYMFQWEWHFWHPGVQPMAETVILWTTVITTGLFIGWWTRSVLRGLAACVLGWASFFTIGAVIPGVFIEDPEFTSLMRGRLPIPLGGLTLSLVVWIALRWRHLGPCVLRMNHALPFAGLAWIGAQLAGHEPVEAFWRALLIFGLCFVLLVQNDFHDAEEDALASRPSASEALDVYIITLIGAFFLLNAGRWAPMTAIAASGMLFLGMAYHHPAFRMKKNFCLSYKIEGGWAAIAFSTGLLGKVSVITEDPVLWPIVLVFGGGALLSMPKDWKDVESDRAARIPTLYVQLTAWGMTLDRAHRWIAGAVTLGLFTGVALLAIRIGWSPAFFALLAGAAITAVPLWFGRKPRPAVELYLLLLGLWLIGAGEVVRWTGA